MPSFLPSSRLGHGHRRRFASPAQPVPIGGISHPRAMPLGRRAPAFAFMELLVVLVIVGLIVLLVAPRYIGPPAKSNSTIARTQIDGLSKALNQYRLDVGIYPSTDQGLQALVTMPEGVERWQGPYLPNPVPPDPWGRPYNYKAPGDHADYDLYSYGADGRAGGTGENLDVTSWDATPAAKSQ